MLKLVTLEQGATSTFCLTNGVRSLSASEERDNFDSHGPVVQFNICCGFMVPEGTFYWIYISEAALHSTNCRYRSPLKRSSIQSLPHLIPSYKPCGTAFE